MAKKTPGPIDTVQRPSLKKSVHSRDRKAKTPNAPGLRHGTRVAFHIDCERCGKEATLPFVPKTDGALLCPDCAAEVFGDDWHRGRMRGERSVEERDCDACSARYEYRVNPDVPAPNLCPKCRRGEARPEPGRIGGAILDPAAGVRRKRPRGGDGDKH